MCLPPQCRQFLCRPLLRVRTVRAVFAAPVTWPAGNGSRYARILPEVPRGAVMESAAAAATSACSWRGPEDWVTRTRCSANIDRTLILTYWPLKPCLAMDFTVQCEQHSAQWRSSFVGKLKTRSWFPEKLGFIRNAEVPSIKCTKRYPHIICIGNTFSVICLCIGNVYTRDKRVVSVTAPAIHAIMGAVNSSVTALTNYAASVSDLGRNKISHPTILCQCPMICSSDIDVNAAWRQHKGFSILILLTTDTLWWKSNQTQSGDNSTSVLVICNILRGVGSAELRLRRQWAGMLFCKRAMQLSRDQPWSR